MKRSEGSITSTIVIIGEGPNSDDIKSGGVFQGFAGRELTKMLGEAGINRANCHLINVMEEPVPWNQFYNKTQAKKFGIDLICNRYPNPKVLDAKLELEDYLETLEPNLIITLGDLAFWAVSELGESVSKWRGSVLETRFGKLIPTFSPQQIIRSWPDRWISVWDLRRAQRESLFPEVRKRDTDYLISPTFEEAKLALESIRGKVVTGDIETRGRQIECVGFGLSKDEAFCIPFMDDSPSGNYWSYDEELELTLLMKDITQDAHIVWQNGAYDLQYFAKQWGYLPNMGDDTMCMMHVCFPGLAKSLDFQASLFCEQYTYWKDDGKTANFEDRRRYNCNDCCYTYENYVALNEALDVYGLREPYNIEMRLFPHVLQMMLTGLRVDTKKKRLISGELLVAQKERLEWLEQVLGHPLNPRSPKQMATLFYNDLGMKPIKDRKTKSVTTNSKALATIKARQPLLGPIVDVIEELRSLGVFKSTFADATLDEDDRLRTSINITGTETFRFSSSKNIFGTGANMQNIPAGTEK